MAKRADLESEARGFADRISGLLNRTVSNGVRLTAIPASTGMLVGLSLGKRQPTPRPVPLTIGDASPGAWLLVSYTFRWDDASSSLVASSSDFNLYADEDMRHAVVRFEYERGKDSYPEAHIQVHGDSPALRTICKQRGMEKRLENLHLPVGGRRYRPNLEDVIEFLVVEGLADARAGWRDAVAEGRREWERIQLAAAVRRDPDTARAALEAEAGGR